jgi:hypothetical protein
MRVKWGMEYDRKRHAFTGAGERVVPLVPGHSVL